MRGTNHSRRTFLAAPAALPALPLRAASGKPKNILFLLSDQHRYDALSIDGHAVARTPALDGLARSGVRFRNTYCTYPICGPARASLWTGLYTHHHRVHANEIPWPAAARSVAHAFSRAGYQTGAVGKMHFADARGHGFDYRLDFNDWYQYLGPKARIFASEVGRPFPGDGHPQIGSLWREGGDPWAGEYEKDGRAGMTHVGRVSSLPEKDHFETFVARESIEFLRRFRNQPFFLIASFLKPHQPFMPAERFAARYRAGDMKLPASFQPADVSRVPQFIRNRMKQNALTPELFDPASARQRIASYYAGLEQMDDCAGAVLRALSSMGLDDDTVVVYTSDHGELLGEHGLWQKFVFYEASVKAPLVIRAKGVTRDGGVCDAPVSHVQLVPTLAELCGVPLEKPADGPSLLPWLRDPHTPGEGPVYAEYDLNSPRPKHMIRRGQWKYCQYKDDLPELFDLRADPAELDNRAADPGSRSRLESLRSELQAWAGLPE
jgi:choline-sulfatase